MGAEEAVHEAVVEAEGDEGGGVGGQAGEAARTERGAAGGPGIGQHKQVPLHEPAGEAVGAEDIEGGVGDAEAGAEGREVVRDGGR